MKHASLEIRLLGPVEVKFDEKLLKISRRMERAILYILAVEHRPISRTKLIDLLWPDADQSDPRASLRTALSRLRNELPDPDMIKTELDQVCLDFEHCFIDVKTFEDHYQHLKHLLSPYQNNRTLPTSIVNQIQKALDLWRGNTILTGDNLEKYHAVEIWRQSTNNKLIHRRKFLMKRLADHYRVSGQDERALSVFMELAKLDFTDIDSQCTALDILISLGRHQDTMNYCDTLENIYEYEFNAPLPDEILSRCQRSQYRIDSDQSETLNQWPIPLAMNLQMVGRQTELFQLHQGFSKGGWISIQGEMGVGKTRLVQELFQTLSPRPILALFYCREMEISLPFSPIINCLRDSVPSEIWTEIDPVWTNQLSLLLPELSAYIKGDEQQPLSKLPAGKQHLFDALLYVCHYISNKYGKMLFFIDNAHWADSQTLQAISYLVSRGFFDRHGLLVIASRSEEKNPELDKIVDIASRRKPMQTIRLNGLNFFELKNLAAQVLDKQPSEAFINKLMQETGGNPFLALEIIRNMLEMTHYPDIYEGSSTIPLPMSIQAVFRKRFSSLDDDARHLLLCSAVLGDNLSLDMLETVAELTPSMISKAIDPLIKSGFIQSVSKNNDNENHLHFSNEIMREVVLNESSNLQLQIIHRQIAQRMASDSPHDDKAGMIASHFLSGGENKKAFQWFLKAAEHAWKLGSQEDAQQSYQQAEKLLKSGPESLFSITDIINLYRQWSDFAYESHQVELVEQIGAKLQYLGNQENHPLFLGTAQVILSDACFLRLDFETGLTLIEEGINNLEIAGDQEALIKAIKRKGVISWWTMNYDDVELSARRVLALSPKIELDKDLRTSLEFNAEHLINMMQYTHGQASLAAQTAQRLYNTYFHKLEPFDRLRSLYLIGYSSLIAADYEKCENSVMRALEIARPLGNGLLEEVLLIILAKAEHIQGKVDRAFQHATHALKSAESAGRKGNIVSANCILGDIYPLLNNDTAALKHYRVGQIREGFSSHSYYGLENNIHFAHYLSYSNQTEEARKILDHALRVTRKYNLGTLYVKALMTSGVWNQKVGNLNIARNHFEEAIKLAKESGLAYELALVKLAYARFLMEKSDIKAAKTHLEEVLIIAQEKNMLWVKLFALMSGIALTRINGQVDKRKEYQASLQKTIDKLKANIEIEPLKDQFVQASEDWIENFL